MKITISISTSLKEQSLWTAPRGDILACVDFISNSLTAQTLQTEGRTVALLTTGGDVGSIVDQLNRLLSGNHLKVLNQKEEVDLRVAVNRYLKQPDQINYGLDND